MSERNPVSTDVLRQDIALLRWNEANTQLDTVTLASPAHATPPSAPGLTAFWTNVHPLTETVESVIRTAAPAGSRNVSPSSPPAPPCGIATG